MRTFIVLLTLGIASVCFALTSWMGESYPATPEIRVVTTTNNELSFQVDNPGFWNVVTDSGVSLIAGESLVRTTHDPITLPTITALIAIPLHAEINSEFESAEYRQLNWEPGTRAINIDYSDPIVVNPMLLVGETSVMRGIPIVPITIPLVRHQDGQLERLSHATIRVKFSQEITSTLSIDGE